MGLGSISIFGDHEDGDTRTIDSAFVDGDLIQTFGSGNQTRYEVIVPTGNGGMKTSAVPVSKIFPGLEELFERGGVVRANLMYLGNAAAEWVAAPPQKWGHPSSIGIFKDISFNINWDKKVGGGGAVVGNPASQIVTLYKDNGGMGDPNNYVNVRYMNGCGGRGYAVGGCSFSVDPATNNTAAGGFKVNRIALIDGSGNLNAGDIVGTTETGYGGDSFTTESTTDRPSFRGKVGNGVAIAGTVPGAQGPITITKS